MGGVGRIDEDKIGGVVGEGDFAGVGLLDVGAGRGEVESERFSGKLLGDVERGAGATHGIENRIPFAGVALEELPDHPCRRGADIVFIAMRFAAVILGRIFPERGGEQRKGWFIHA